MEVIDLLNDSDSESLFAEKPLLPKPIVTSSNRTAAILLSDSSDDDLQPLAAETRSTATETRSTAAETCSTAAETRSPAQAQFAAANLNYKQLVQHQSSCSADSHPLTAHDEAARYQLLPTNHLLPKSHEFSDQQTETYSSNETESLPSVDDEPPLERDNETPIASAAEDHDTSERVVFSYETLAEPSLFTGIKKHASRTGKRISDNKHREEAKCRKQKEKEIVALQKMRDVALRKALREAQRAAKPGESHRHMVIEVDFPLRDTPLGICLDAMCMAQGVAIRYVDHPLRNSVLFKRIMMSVQAPGSNQPVPQKTELLEENFAIILSMDDVALLVQPEIPSHQLSLLEYVANAQRVYERTPTLLMLGCERFFRAQKTDSNKKYKDQVSGAQRVVNKRKKQPSITRLELENCLLEVQVNRNVSVVNHETEEELAKSVLRINKALAEAPAKRERYANEIFQAKASGLRISKDGQGALLVWQHMLQEFRNISAEVAAAIVSEWPSPRLLYEKYLQCRSQTEAETLLQDIEVRRGGGVLQTTRRVGRETSRRIYQLFTMTDPNFIIK